VQKIRKIVGNRWGLSRKPIYFMNKPNVETNNIIGGLITMVLLNWFSKYHDNFKFKYDVIDINWVDIDSIISTITMNYEKEKIRYWLNCLDAILLDEFVTNKYL
jgi:hypothetical protein